MQIKIDRNIYSDSCISKTIYWYSDNFSFNRHVIGNYELIDIFCKSKDVFDENDFIDKLNDFKLRCIIEEETKDIRTILYAKAFAEYDDLTDSDFE